MDNLISSKEQIATNKSRAGKKRQIGLIGDSLTHSLSQKYFTEKFKKLGVQETYKYTLFPISEVSKVANIISSNSNLVGLNVTSPYKETIIPFLNEIDRNILSLGTVNVIKIKKQDGETILKGYNTDIYGLKKVISNLNIPIGTKALILGSGGSGKSIRFVLKEMGIDYTVVSRNPKTLEQLSYSKLNERIIREHLFIVNATPVGMFPNISNYPNIPYSGITQNHICLDLIYNPDKTLFLSKCEEMGAKICNGLEILYEQADKAWEIWNEENL